MTIGPRACILAYHALSSERREHRYALGESLFDEQLQYLREQGYTTALAGDALALRGANFGVARQVVLTFDDGHASDYTVALPLLARYGMKASFFVTTGWIGKSGYLTAEQVVSLRRAGMQVQSHGVTHRFLDCLNRRDLAEELAGSKDCLEDLLGESIDMISLPGGRYSDGVIKCARDAGYVAVFSSCPFKISSRHGIAVLGRSMIKRNTCAREFGLMLGTSAAAARRLQWEYALKRAVQKACGGVVYQKLWEFQARLTQRQSRRIF